MITSRAKKVGAVAIMYCLISVVVLLMVLYTTEQNKNKFTDVKTKYAEAESARQLSSVIEQTLNISKSDRETLETYFISERDTIHFIARVEEIAKLLNVVVETTQLSVDPVTEKEPISKLKIGFMVRGGYTGVSSMLSALETIPYHHTVQEVSLKETSEGEWEGAIVMYVTLQ